MLFQLLGHGVHAARNLGKLVPPREVDAVLQLPLLQRLCAFGQRVQRAPQGAAKVGRGTQRAQGQ